MHRDKLTKNDYIQKLRFRLYIQKLRFRLYIRKKKKRKENKYFWRCVLVL